MFGTRRVKVSEERLMFHILQSGDTALIAASREGHKDVVAYLLGRGADIEARGEYGSRALTAAAFYLLDRGADIEAHDADCFCTPLVAAASRGHRGVVECLFDRGANIEAAAGEEDGMTPLVAAAYLGHKDVVAYLLDRGADVEAGIDECCRLLTGAAVNGHREVVECLLD
jgi:ankyrin repeat protein